jgi:hypothetical protein
VITRQRRRILPEQSRLTIPRTVAALRHSRRLLTDIEGQLGSLLVSLRQEQPSIDVGAPDRLTGATAQAGRALAALEDLRCLW